MFADQVVAGCGDMELQRLGAGLVEGDMCPGCNEAPEDEFHRICRKGRRKRYSQADWMVPAGICQPVQLLAGGLQARRRVKGTNSAPVTRQVDDDDDPFG